MASVSVFWSKCSKNSFGLFFGFCIFLYNFVLEKNNKHGNSDNRMKINFLFELVLQKKLGF